VPRASGVLRGETEEQGDDQDGAGDAEADRAIGHGASLPARGQAEPVGSRTMDAFIVDAVLNGWQLACRQRHEALC
jgi:hypothetical protein